MRLLSLRTAILAIVSLPLVALGAHAADTATSVETKNTHLLALAACPPWKTGGNAEMTKLMADSCREDVNAVVPALQKALKASTVSTVVRLDQDANFSGVETAIRELAKRAKRSDRVVIYLNFHGGDLGAMYKGYRIKDEVLALYSKERPADFLAASANHTWMTTKYLRDLIDEIKAEEIVVIIEACESESGLHDFRYDLAKRYEDNWQGREAVIFSARADQSAAFTADRKMAQFTKSFSDELLASQSGSLADVFHRASIATHRAARETCMMSADAKAIFEHRAAYLDGCTQMPMAFDPYGLLDDIKMGGGTSDAKWRKFLAKMDAGDDADGTVKKTTSSPAATKHTAAKQDPFDWARPYLNRGPAYVPGVAAPVQREMPVQAPTKKDPFAWAKPYLERTSIGGRQ